MAKEKTVKLHDWLIHRSGCADCRLVDTAKTASLANVCLTGAPLLRDYANFIVSPDIRKKRAALRNEFMQQEGGVSKKASKRELAAVMRFV
jgi:hypothetical protein